MADVKADIREIPPSNCFPDDRNYGLLEMMNIFIFCLNSASSRQMLLEPCARGFELLPNGCWQGKKLLGKFSEGGICALYFQGQVAENHQALAFTESLI